MMQRKRPRKVPLGGMRIEMERHRVNASWTMSAASAEWRKTQALEAELAS